MILSQCNKLLFEKLCKSPLIQHVMENATKILDITFQTGSVYLQELHTCDENRQSSILQNLLCCHWLIINQHAQSFVAL